MLMVFLMVARRSRNGRYLLALTAVAIKNAKGRDKPYKLSDRDGLYLLVTPSGGRYWRMNYGHLGKQKTLAFGVWPDTGLADARAQGAGAGRRPRRADQAGAHRRDGGGVQQLQAGCRRVAGEGREGRP